MVKSTLKISLGNKIIGTIAFVVIILFALSVALPYFSWETLLVAALLVSIYSFQASRINYVSFGQGQFFIENMFKPVIRKDAFLFDKVVEIFYYTHLMKIKFKDGSSYLFWGKSDVELNRLIRETMGD
jgi:hypothetical protein